MAYFTYKGYPLVRKGNELYYGNMGDDFVVWMQIEKSQKLQDTEVATKVRVYLMSTQEGLNPIEAIKKNGERDNLFEALDLAGAWLAQTLIAAK